MSQHTGHPLAALWVYTLLRIALFGALVGLLWLFGVRGLLGAVIALVLSVPLSFLLLARPRQALVAGVTGQVEARRVRTSELDVRLSGNADDQTRPGQDRGTQP
jgi:Protein of unknown function (DUF4229)